MNNQKTDRKTLVLALGNPLRGDDGVGAAVLQQLDQMDLPPHVTMIDGGTPGLESVLLLQGYQRAIIIDAADMGREAGEWECFSPQNVDFSRGDIRGTLHYAGLAEALTLGGVLNILPDEIMIYGVQPEIIGWSPGLSEPVQTAIPQVSTSILSLL